MVVVCEKCGSKYHVDDQYLKDGARKVRCKNCKHVFTVSKSTESPEDVLDVDNLLQGNDTVASGSAGTSENVDDLLLASDSQQSAKPAKKGVFKKRAARPAKKKDKKKAQRRWGLTGKVIVVLLLIGIIPVAVYSALTYNVARKEITARELDEGTRVVNLFTDFVNNWVDRNISTLKIVAATPSLESMDPYDVKKVVESLKKEDTEIFSAYVTDTTGMVIARSDDQPLRNYADRNYIKKIIAGADIALETGIGKTSHQPTLLISVPIKRDSQLVGVLVQSKTRAVLDALLLKYTKGKTGLAHISDNTNKIVAHSDNKLVLKEIDMSKNALVAEKFQAGTIIHKQFQDDRDGYTYLGFAGRTTLGWTIAVQQQVDEAYEQLRHERNIVIVLVGIAILVIIIVAYFASRAIVVPVKRVTTAANEISMGHLDYELKKTSNDEIGDLAEAVSRMQDSLRYSISRLQKK